MLFIVKFGKEVTEEDRLITDCLRMLSLKSYAVYTLDNFRVNDIMELNWVKVNKCILFPAFNLYQNLS